MTDPEMADVTYIEPITWQMVAKIIERERPDALLPTMGGQTALNCALDLAREGVLDEVRRRADRRVEEGDRQGRGPREVQGGDDAHRPRLGALRHRAQPRGGARRCRPDIGFPAVIRPSFTLGGTGGGIAYNKDEFVEMCKRGLDALADARAPDRGVAARLERVRDGGRARPQGQLHHRLLDREPRSDGRAHRRLDHRRAGADADRQGIPDHARRLDRGAARDRRRHRRLERAVRDQSGRRPHDRHRDEPARVALLGARVEGDRLPDRQGRGEARGRLHARRAAERHHRRRDAGVVRADDRLRRHQGAALRVREVQAGRRPAHHADEVGRRSDGDRPHVPGVAAEGAARPRDRRRRLQPQDRRSGQDRRRARVSARRAPLVRRRRVRHRHVARGDPPATRRSIRGSWRRSRRSSTSS